MNRSPLRLALDDRLVIYYSGEDACWIAHSMRTDQLGTGDCIVDALADAIKTVNYLLAEAQDDPTIAVLRDAPANVQKLAKKARKLPGELFEIAHKKATGHWPKDLNIDVTSDSPKDQSYMAELQEQAAR